MKRLVLGMIVLAMCGVLLAQASYFSPRASIRTGFFYDMSSWKVDEGSDDPDSRLTFLDDHFTQGNSRFGMGYEKENITGNVEFGFKGGDAELRLLYGKYAFDGWSLLAGKDADGTDMQSNQTFYNDNGLQGYGAMFGGRNPQIKLGFFDDRLYLALIKTNFAQVPESLKGTTDNLIPKINVGWKDEYDNGMKFHGTAMIQMLNYNEDFGGNEDANVMSWLVGVVYEATAFENLKVKVHGHAGSNIADMGFADGGLVNANQGSVWDGEEVKDTMSMGGFLTLNLDKFLIDQLGIGVGVGYAMTTKDVEDTDPDNRMAFYLQLPYKTSEKAFTITPEFGMFTEMNGYDGEAEEVTNIYFGAQLRYDF